MEYRSTRFARCGASYFGTFVAAGAVSIALLGTAGDARAAGFALKEQSATALGNAFAGATAGAEDVSYMFFNPAGLTRQEGHQSALALSYIIVQGETNDAVGALGGDASSGDAAEDALVPAAYGMWSVNPDLKVAVGVNAPFGLTTKYSETWAGRFHAVESSMTTVNVNPAVAYKINDKFSIGAGLQIQYVDVTLSSIIDQDFNPGNGVQEGLAEVTGDDWGFGFNLGLLYEISDTTRAGLSYRSSIDHEIKGTFASPLASDGASADFKAPDSVNVGVFHDVNDQWAVMAEVMWTGWSSFDELRVVGDSLGTLSVTPEDWKDVWFYAAGATWKPNENWTIRAGLAYDQSPITDARRTPRITDEDRTWVALGAQFHPSPNFTIDVGYTHVFIDDATVNLTSPVPLTATYENTLDIITAQATFRF